MMPLSHSEVLLVTDNLGLVLSQCLQIKPKNGADLEDLIQAGSVGLVLAAVGFNPSLGNTFQTYAWACIRNEIIRELKKWNRTKPSKYGYLTQQALIEDYPQPNIDSYKEYLSHFLSTVEHEVLELKAQGYTLKEIGSHFGYSREWARKIVDGILIKLRASYYNE